MRDTLLRLLSDDERNMLYDMMEDDDEDSSYRAKIIILKDKGYTVPEIRRATNHHDSNIRKWIHRFNEYGVEGITPKIHKRKSVKITPEIEKKIVEIASKNPREGYGLPFSTWSLRVLAGYVSKELDLVNSTSHTEIRNILLKHGKVSSTIKDNLGKQHRSTIRFKKKRIEELRYSPPIDSVILYEDEKGPPIAAKTYGGPSWSSSQSKVSKAQKTNGILNVFGVYDYTNNQMLTHPRLQA
jgi:transposase